MDDYSKFSDAELMQAVELLVRPEWLRERAVMIAILAALDYTPACVQEQLDEGKPLHDGELLKLTRKRLAFRERPNTSRPLTKHTETRINAGRNTNQNTTRHLPKFTTTRGNTMTRRERLEKKLEKREEWAEKAHERASEEFETASDLIKDLPAGQPILVGHHSEKAHRRLLERSGSHMDKGCEQYKLAKHHEDKAQGLARQLENTIFSDDEDAVERLQEKLDDRRKRQDGYKKINKILRTKGLTPAEKLKEIRLVGIIGEQTATELIEKGCTLPAYMLTNNNSEIRRIEKRIEEIKRRQEQQAEAEQAGGVVARYWPPDCMTVTFAEKPEYSIIRALKDAGFYFSRGSWHGRKDALPECVRDLLPEESEAKA